MVGLEDLSHSLLISHSDDLSIHQAAHAAACWTAGPIMTSFVDKQSNNDAYVRAIMRLKMHKPAIATLVTASAPDLAALLPGLDGNALIGAFAGAALFVTNSRDLPLVHRTIYLVISTVVGYFAAPEVLADLPLHSVAMAAFLAGALVVTLTVQLIERAKSFDLSTLFKKGR